MLAFIVQRFRSQLRFFPIPQQALAIGGLLLNDRVVSAAVHLAIGEPQVPWAYWWAPLLGMLLWAPLFLLLDGLRQELDRQCIRTPEVLASSLGDEAVVLGAVRLALDQVDGVMFDIDAGPAAGGRQARRVRGAAGQS